MLITLILLSVLPFLLLLLARRGRRIDDHTLCRNCHFDLTGLPPTSDNCPECGRNIRSPHTTTLGHRRPIRPLLLAAWLLFIPSLLLSITLLTLNLTHTSLIRYEPLFLLNANLTTPATPDSTAALHEITQRLDAGSLSTADLAPTIDKILRLQSDTTHPWDRALGDLVLDAATRSLLDPARWETFLAHSLQMDIRVSPHIRRNATVTVSISPSFERLCHWRTGSLPQVTFSADTTLDSVTQHIGPSTMGGAGVVSIGFSFPPTESWSSPPDRTHAVTVHYTATVSAFLPGSGTTTGSTTLSFRTVPPSTSFVKANRDPATIAAFQKAITLLVPTIPLPTPTRRTSVILHIDNPPLPVYFDAELVQGPSHWPFQLTLGVSPFGTSDTLFILDETHPPQILPHPGPAEVLLTPTNLDPDHPLTDPAGKPITELFAEPLHLPITLTAP